MNRKLLLEGGAAGHMAHPFDLGWVKTGRDLIKFFTSNTVQHLADNNPTVKFDGINVSFKLVKSKDIKGNVRFQFAVDRGSMKPIDLEGVTLSRIGERFPEGHGMRPAIEALLTTFNAALDSGAINEEIRLLGMDENSDLYLNTEYVREKEDESGNKTPMNVVLYNEDFFAIHGLNSFVEVVSPKRGSKSRGSVEVSLDREKQNALQSLIEKARNFATDYNVYGPKDAETELNKDIDFNEALEQEVTIVLSPDNVLTDTLRGWLNNPEVINPFGARVDLLNGKDVGAISKFIYTNLIPDADQPIPLSELVQNTEEDRKLAINGALFNHGTRLLGRKVLEATGVNIGSPIASEHEGIVMRDDDLFGIDEDGKPIPVKITGDFIVSGMSGTISALVKPEKGITEVPQSKRIGLVPMAAKPFHKGHMALIEMAANQNDQVKVFVSLSDRAKKGEFPVYGAQMQEIWKNHLMNLMPNNVNIEFLSTGMQPVRLVYETLTEASEAHSPNTFTVYSDPVDTRQNYSENYRQQYFGDLYGAGQVLFAAEENPAQFTRGTGTPDASGTMARKALADNNFEVFADLMPDGVDAQAIWDILGGGSTEEESEEQEVGTPPIFVGESALRFIFETIENRLEERDYQKDSEVIEKHDEEGGSLDRLLDRGTQEADAGDSPYRNEREQTRAKSAAPGYPGGGSIGHVVEASSMAAGDVQGYAGSISQEDDEKKQPSLIREEDDELVEETMDYLLKMMRGGI